MPLANVELLTRALILSEQRAMTLILSVLTREYVAQVSDRRLTSLDGSQFEDKKNKAVVVCGHWVFAYTGLANVGPGNQRTQEWLLEQLADESLSITESMEKVATEAAGLLARIKLPAKFKRQAFVGVGWVEFVDNPSLPGYQPVLLIASNFTDAKMNAAAEARNRFTTHFLTLGEQHRFYVHAAGVPLRKSEFKDLVHVAGSVTKRGQGRAMAQLLIETARAVASRNAAVGDSLLVSVIPRAEVPLPMMAWASPPKEGEAMFAFVRGSTDDEFSFYGPDFTCDGAMIADVAFEVRKPPSS